MSKPSRCQLRDMIKGGLLHCTEAQQIFFKRIYSGLGATLEEPLSDAMRETQLRLMPIEDVVDKLEDDKLDIILAQVLRTVKDNI